MIVLLTWRHLLQVKRAVYTYDYGRPERQIPLNETLCRWLEEDTPLVGTKSMRQVTLPAVGWLRVQEAMVEHCFTKYGRRDREAPMAAATALKRIQRAINLRERHPALTSGGVLGVVGDLIPAWQSWDKQSYSPYPDGGGFVVLAPRHDSSAGGPITTWSPLDRWPDHPLFEEAAHWELT